MTWIKEKIILDILFVVVFFAIDGSVLQNSKQQTLFLTAFLTLQTPLQSAITPKYGNL